ncbi:MAG: TonB-dependent receptor [Terracidiphilus sp.]
MANAQSDRATITGTVKDSAGAVLPGATVTVTNRDTGVTYTTPTNGDGVYSIPNVPVGIYALEVRHGGFKTYTQTGISPLASQEIRADVIMTVGATSETVTVSAAAPALESQNATESTTLEPTAIEELPLNASGGRNAFTLLMASSPNVSEASITLGGTQSWIGMAGGQTFTNSLFIDGANASAAGNQGYNIPPVQEGIQEMQVQTNVTDAELAQTGGGSIVVALKSGTNKLHGSAFENLQNQVLNANQWIDNYYNVPRAPYSFNDYGGSVGGPIWKNHTFFFADIEYYKQTDYTLNPTGSTVPLTSMVTVNGSGNYDLSPLLTMGASTGNIPNPNGGGAWINPCTGNPYQYGQVFDPATWTQVGGVTCATPFINNQIPQARVGAISQNIAAAYAKYYAPTQDRLISGNFSSYAGTPSEDEYRVDAKVDHNFSDKHRISVSLNYGNVLSKSGETFPATAGPFSGYFDNGEINYIGRVIDNYTITPNLINTASVSFNRQATTQSPTPGPGYSGASGFGFFTSSPNSFPLVQYDNSVNGVGFSSFGESWDIYWNDNAYNYADNLQWQKGRHSVKFGWQWTAWQENADNYQETRDVYDFQSQAGGPTDQGLTPYVGSSFSSMLLGTAQDAYIEPTNYYIPRQKYMGLFAQDDFKVSPKLTVNLGVRWDLTLPIKWPNAAWENWDINTVNPNWAPYGGAWTFSPNSGSTFEKDIPLYQFGPHLGAAYSISPKLVARASYNLTYVPANSVGAGAADYYLGSQDPLNGVGCSTVNTIPGSYVYDWESGAPCTQSAYQKTSSSTAFGDAGANIMDVMPGALKLGRTNTLYLGVEYEVAPNVVLDVRYLGTFGRALQDLSQGRSASFTPDYSTYNAVLQSGQINTTIDSAASAAAVSAKAGVTVPYPFPGFNGPAYAAIAPEPQLAQYNFDFEEVGNPAYLSKSNYNSFVAEMKVRNTHGLFVDWSYTISKYTSNSSSDSWGVPTNFGNTWGTDWQSPQDNEMWPVADDQRQLAKGYLTYDLPLGRGKAWLNNSSTVLNEIVGGWTLGYYGAYGSGLPMSDVRSSYQLPYYFGGCDNCGNGQRAFFANGATATSMKNFFHKGGFNPGAPTATGNNDFSPSAFASGTAAAPFGNTPLYFNNWRWNSAPAAENMSLLKHFSIGKEDRYKAEIRGDFFDVFNRHYFNAPDMGINDSTFGDVTGVAWAPGLQYSNRVGQVGARFEF